MAAGIPQLVGTIRCNQGNLAARREQWAQASEHFLAAIEVSQASGHPHDAVEAMIGLAKVEHQTGRRDEARLQLQAARALSADIRSPQRVAEVDAALAELTAQTSVPQTSVSENPLSENPAAQRAPAVPSELTPRQAEVLSLLAAGMSNKQIAAELFLSPATVERHLATMYRNLGLGGRVEAARFAIERGLAPDALSSRQKL
jgi:DNA-binding CsgD family transcriptional regulator